LLTLEARLLENLNDEQRFGPSNTLQTERARIARELNRLGIQLNLDFNSLCQGQTYEDSIALEVVEEVPLEELDYLYRTGQQLEAAGYVFEASAKYWQIWQTQPEFRDVTAKLATMESPKQEAFAGRQAELKILMQTLERSLLGVTSIVFLSGDPGTGKTALVKEFLRQAQTKYKDIVYSIGSCGAQSGVGEPYLPFKEIFSLLCGDVERQLSQGNISVEDAYRLAQVAPVINDIILDFAPNLTTMLAPMISVDVKQYGTSGKKTNDQALNQSVITVPPAVSEYADSTRLTILFECSLILARLAKTFPLILIVDDLQWSDAASLDLLYYLGTRLRECPIVLIGIFRSSDTSDAKNPLANCISEIKLRNPKLVEISLDRVDEEFVQQFVARNYAPHQFRPETIGQIQTNTGGNALFVSELFQYFKETDKISKNEQGAWGVRGQLAFHELPSKVETVIEARISRLEANVRKILEAASIEGEEFTAQVIAKLRGVDDRQLLEKLSDELERKWHLVAPTRSLAIQEQRLYLYRFKHALIRTYLYDRVNPVERELLHRDIGLFLEVTYGDDVEQISSVLAEHFRRASMPKKEANYRLISAQECVTIGDQKTAIYHLNRLETILDDHPESFKNYTGLAKQLYRMRGNLYALMMASDKAQRDFHKLETKARIDKDACALVSALCGYGLLKMIAGEFLSAREFLTLAEQSVPKCKSPETVADYQLLTAKVAYFLAQYEQTIEWGERAHALYTRTGNWNGVFASLSRVAAGYYAQGNYKRCEAMYVEILTLAREHSNLSAEFDASFNLAVSYWRRGLYPEAKDFFSIALEITDQMNDELSHAYCINNLGLVEISLENFTKAEILIEDALRTFRLLEAKLGQAWALGNLGDAISRAGRGEEGIELLKESRSLSQQIELKGNVAESARRLSQAYYRLSNLSESYRYAQIALQEAEEIGRQDFVGMAYRVLGEVAATARLKPEVDLPEMQEPETYLEQSVQIARETNSIIEEIEALRIWGNYLVRLPDSASRKKGANLMQEASALQEELKVRDSTVRILRTIV